MRPRTKARRLKSEPPRAARASNSTPAGRPIDLRCQREPEETAVAVHGRKARPRAVDPGCLVGVDPAAREALRRRLWDTREPPHVGIGDQIAYLTQPPLIENFESDSSADAFAKVVDRLLASPRYGERWGRHWLDVVRYTDSFDSRILEGDSVLECKSAFRCGGDVYPRGGGDALLGDGTRERDVRDGV